MEITVNNTPHEIEDNSVLTDAVELLQLTEKSGIAIALNEQIVPRNQWSEQPLSPNDKLLIITATQGG